MRARFPAPASEGAPFFGRELLVKVNDVCGPECLVMPRELGRSVGSPERLSGGRSRGRTRSESTTSHGRGKVGVVRERIAMWGNQHLITRSRSSTFRVASGSKRSSKTRVAPACMAAIQRDGQSPTQKSGIGVYTTSPTVRSRNCQDFGRGAHRTVRVDQPLGPPWSWTSRRHAGSVG